MRLLDTKKDTIETKVPMYISLCAEAYRSMTSGYREGHRIQEIRPGAGFETADFVKEKLGGLP